MVLCIALILGGCALTIFAPLVDAARIACTDSDDVKQAVYDVKEDTLVEECIAVEYDTTAITGYPPRGEFTRRARALSAGHMVDPPTSVEGEADEAQPELNVVPYDADFSAEQVAAAFVAMSAPKPDVAEDVADTGVSDPSTAAFVKDKEQTVVKKHRRVHAKQQFVAGLAAEVKGKFGLMQRSGANELVVRRVLHQRCEELKVRPTHAKQAIARAIELVFLPDADDVFAARMRSSYAAQDRLEQYKKAKYGALHFLPMWFLEKFGSRPNANP